VRIHVVDQGAGIPKHLVVRLFVPFDRLGADAGQEGGAGLGLVFARRLTETMRETLELRSTVGAGTHAAVAVASAARDRPTSRPEAVPTSKPSRSVGNQH